MKILTIKRPKWRRGGTRDWAKGVTRLLNDNGLMCCLGFDALACGVSADTILNRVDPECLPLDVLPADYRDVVFVD